MKNRWFIAVALILAAGSAGAQETAPPFSAQQVGELVPLKQSVLTVQDLAAAGLMEPVRLQEATDRYLGLAGRIAGRPVTLDELMAVQSGPGQLTALQKFAGFITFVNILWVIAIIIGVGSFIYLFGDFARLMFEILAAIPLVLYELVFYGISLGLIFWADSFRPGVSHYVALTGCLLFAGAMGFTISRRNLTRGTGFGYFAVLAALYACVALLYTSSMIGFLAVIALMGALGFSVIAGPLCYCIGFQSEDALGKATVAAMAMLAAFVGFTIAGTGTLEVFRPGALWMGSFVGFLGLLIASSKWYERNFPYAVMQVVTVIAGIAALFIGSVWHISEFQRIGGTFFALYLVEKYAEIPVRSMRGYAVLGLTGSAFVYWFCLTVKDNPEAWRPFLLF
ncbi:MAG TPA: hypothetical protein VD862_04170 [Candidatus Paceibacterota bacterium]|nr:hypothetical protein [Candidatus Paceibacterota bacterium]